MITSPLDTFDPVLVGERLRSARESAGKTQAEAANELNAARTTVVAIEKGQRKVRIEELQALSHLYGTSVNSLFRAESVHVNFEPQFRKLPDCSDTSIDGAVQLISDLVRAEVEMENLLGIKRARNDPPERPLLPGDVRIQAEQDAQELRQWLGMPVGPILDVVTLLELGIGARVYVRKIDPRISGVFVYNESTGPCILLNANHPRKRRNHSAIHELAHFVSERNKPQIYREDTTTNSREERYADAFARAFLTPSRLVMQKFKEITAGSGTITRRHIIILAHYFGVSREAMVRRLEELRLVPSGTWDWFSARGGITDEQEKQVLGEAALISDTSTSPAAVIPLRLTALAAEVYKQGLMSEGQLSRLLGVDRFDLRGLLDESEE